MKEFDKVMQAVDSIRVQLNNSSETIAEIGVVLGSGLGYLADFVLEKTGSAVSYNEIPHFPTSSVAGHKGRLVHSEHAEKSILLMQGRVHRYEGYEPADVVFPIRVMIALGVKKIIITNAAGGFQDGMRAGDLMLIKDHLNLTGDNPLSGENDERFGPRFPDMTEAYSKKLRQMAKTIAAEKGITLKEGVYAGVLGPTYETPAEIAMFKLFGAHAVGMSTVYETIAAAHQSVEVLGISCITNLAAGLGDEKLSHEDVKDVAQGSEAQFSELVLECISRM